MPRSQVPAAIIAHDREVGTGAPLSGYYSYRQLGVHVARCFLGEARGTATSPRTMQYGLLDSSILVALLTPIAKNAGQVHRHCIPFHDRF